MNAVTKQPLTHLLGSSGMSGGKEELLHNVIFYRIDPGEEKTPGVSSFPTAVTPSKCSALAPCAQSFSVHHILPLAPGFFFHVPTLASLSTFTHHHPLCSPGPNSWPGQPRPAADLINSSLHVITLLGSSFRLPMCDRGSLPRRTAIPEPQSPPPALPMRVCLCGGQKHLFLQLGLQRK